MPKQDDAYYLREALACAEQRRGFCAPNPSVGAVVVNDGYILGRGAHWACGLDHAEVVAIRAALNDRGPSHTLWNSTLYVTLEPCCHQGRTAACTDAIIHSGLISRVIYAQQDPNPKVSGRGRDTLLAHGIDCKQVALDEITAFYESYCYWTRTGLPWTTAKLAMSLDGKIAGPGGKPVTITGSALQIYTHKQRRRADALLTTATTIKADNPQLNSRFALEVPEEEPVTKPVYVLDTLLSTPLDAQLFKTGAPVTLFHSEAVPAERIATYTNHADTIDCIAIPTVAKRLSLSHVLAEIGRAGVHDLWIEAGGRCFEAFLNGKHLQRAILYVAPQWLGADAVSAFSKPPAFLHSERRLSWSVVGEDSVLDVRL